MAERPPPKARPSRVSDFPAPKTPRVLTLTINRAGGRDDPSLLRPSEKADLDFIAGMGLPPVFFVGSQLFIQLLTLCSNRRVKVVIDYDVPRLKVRPKLATGAVVKKASRGKAVARG